jgi:hypothetical protein
VAARRSCCAGVTASPFAAVAAFFNLVAIRSVPSSLDAQCAAFLVN